MTGRGIDQALPHPSDPRLYEPYIRSATGYVDLAERANGPIPRPVDFAYPWGAALDELERRAPDARIVNLETAVTTSDEAWPDKHIHYRMHPDNLPCLTTARIDCCVLANNHVLDWGRTGLRETCLRLQQAGVATAGAGLDEAQAERPAILDVPGRGRILVFAFGSETSGIPRSWASSMKRAGVALLEGLSDAEVSRISGRVRDLRAPGDVVVVSIHWGDNWGYAIPSDQVRFAHALIDEAGVDLVHGHSSHHPKAIEIYRGRPVFYGCGDFLNDYEGIRKHREYRGELCLMYFVSVDPRKGRLLALQMVPMRVRRFRLQRASREEAEWLRTLLDREGRALGTRVELDADGILSARWNGGG